MQSLGADEVIPYDSAAFDKVLASNKVDLIVDSVGGKPIHRLMCSACRRNVQLCILYWS